MADSKLKLYYFDLKGRAEVARLLLAAAGKPYEDIRWSREEWPKYKPSAPFGQAPWLEVDGKKFGQSIAIKTFLAREFGFYPPKNLEGLKVDQVLQLFSDMGQAIMKTFQARGEASEDDTREKIRGEVTPKFLSFFEQLLKDNGTGYFVGDKLTVADITLFDVVTGITNKCVKIDDYPLSKKNTELVMANDRIRKYVQTRKVTEY